MHVMYHVPCFAASPGDCCLVALLSGFIALLSAPGAVILVPLPVVVPLHVPATMRGLAPAVRPAAAGHLQRTWCAGQLALCVHYGLCL